MQVCLGVFSCNDFPPFVSTINIPFPFVTIYRMNCRNAIKRQQQREIRTLQTEQEKKNTSAWKKKNRYWFSTFIWLVFMKRDWQQATACFADKWQSSKEKAIGGNWLRSADCLDCAVFCVVRIFIEHRRSFYGMFVKRGKRYRIKSAVVD